MQILEVVRKKDTSENESCFNILNCLSLQVVLLSATMPAEVLDVTQRFMIDPVRILVRKEELTLEGIKQFYIMVEKEVGVILS